MKKEFKGQSKKGGVYQIRNLINGKVYIGSAKCFQVRASQHTSSLKENKHQNKHLQASFNKWGEDAFLFEVLEVIDGDKLQRTTREQQYLEKWYENWEQCYNFQRNPICKQPKIGKNVEQMRRKRISLANKNKKRSTEYSKKLSERMKTQWKNEKYKRKICEFLTKNKPAKGYKHTQEHKQKMSQLMTGENNPNYGKSLTKQQRLIISNANKGNKNWLGKKHSDETVKQISKTISNLWKNPEYKNKIIKRKQLSVRQIDPKTNKTIKIWGSIKEAETKLKINGISGVCRGKHKTCGNFVWKYTDINQ